MKRIYRVFLILVLATGASFAQETEQEEPKRIMFTNVNVFDGVSETLNMNTSVLVEGNLIKSVGSSISLPEGTEIIDGGGRTLMPGLIENHAHLMLMGPTLPAMEGMTTWEDFAIHGAAMSEMYLMQGFTTLRDAGGSNAGLQRAINAGTIVGPRLYPSGAFLGGRGGHADFANFTAPIGQSTNFSRLNMAQEVDGVDDMLKFRAQQFPHGSEPAQGDAVRWCRLGLRPLADGGPHGRGDRGCSGDC